MTVAVHDGTKVNHNQEEESTGTASIKTTYQRSQPASVEMYTGNQCKPQQNVGNAAISEFMFLNWWTRKKHHQQGAKA